MRRGRWTWRRFLGTGALLLAALTGLGALLHLPAARPLLAWLGAPCPVRNVSADTVQALRRPALRALQGESAAPHRPALGLALEATRMDEAREWARRHGVACVGTVRGLHYLQCQRVSGRALGLTADSGGVDDLSLAFDERGLLIGVDALRSGLSAESAARLGAGIITRLQSDLGAPTEAVGEWTPAFFGAGGMPTSIVRYRFRDYVALVTATRVAGSGVIVRELYLSVTEG
jgi:hypothetical protein